MPRPFKICSSKANLRIAAELIAAGVSDQQIADRIGDGVGRMAITRQPVGVSVGAEAAGQRIAVSSLAAQQLRSSEIRARLGGHGGAQRAGKSQGQPFSLTILFDKGPLHIEGTVPQNTIDVTPVDPLSVEVDPDDSTDDGV